jgi:hypothetical protein
MKNLSPCALASALVLILAAACSSPSSKAPNAPGSAAITASLPGGTPIAVDVTAPLDGALVASPPGTLHLAGTVSVGKGEAQLDTALVYLVDATTAAGAAATCGDATTVLACELQALAALNARAVSLGTVGDVGAAVFGGGGHALDVGPADGAQLLAAPGADANGAGGPDVLEALGTLVPGGGATKFTAVSVGTGPAQVGSGLAAAFDVAAASALPARTVVLLSASTNAAGPTADELTPPDGVVVRAFALPGTTCAAGLDAFAARGAEGSGCEDVTDLAELSDKVASVLDASLASLALTIDGGPTAVPLVAGPLPAPAPFEASFEAVVTALPPGVHELCVSASGTDAGGAGTAKECVSVKVATIAVSPPEATHELGTPGQTATVTALVAAGEAGGVVAVPVVFEVKSGPNAGKGETVPTGADGKAVFTYEALQHLAGLGTDEIQACFEDAEGTKACQTAEVTWQDTTPPVVACLPGRNPGGQTVKRGASGGDISPSGFMRLVAIDAVDPAPVVFLVDTGSGTVFGPFPSGKDVKYTQAPGAPPSAREMGSDEGGGLEILHIKGNGDPAVRGKDAAGNESDPLVCAVPPWKR